MQTLRRLGDTDGFTLVELMTVTMLMMVILSAAYLAMGTVNTVADGMIARTAGQDQGQIALETMVRELRQGQIIIDAPSTNEQVRLGSMTSNQVTFFTDIDHDGYVERITYKQNGALLQRTVARSNKANPYLSDFGSDGAPTTLANIDPSDTTIFRYTDAKSPPDYVTDDTDVSAVMIDLSTVASSGSTSITVAFPTAEADVRAFQ